MRRRFTGQLRLRGARGGARRGATMVEFAFVFLLFMSLIVLTIEGGRLVWSWVTLTHATREGARLAMVHGKRDPVADSVIENYVKTRCIGLDPSDINVSLSWADSDKSRGSLVSLDSQYSFTSVVPSFLGGTVSATFAQPVRRDRRQLTDCVTICELKHAVGARHGVHGML